MNTLRKKPIQKQTYGNLRFIDVKSIEDYIIESTDIIVINGTPSELPPVAGVITTDFQTPLTVSLFGLGNLHFPCGQLDPIHPPPLSTLA